MGFIKGQPKPPGSGKKKGSKHKAPQDRETVRDILDNLNVNVVHQLIGYLNPNNHKDITDKDRVKILISLMEYAYPKPRSEGITIDMCPNCQGSDVNLNLSLQSILRTNEQSSGN